MIIKILGSKDEAPEGTHWVSPSQIDSYIKCPACWAREHISGIKSEQGYWAALGTKVHNVLEKYLKTGVLDREEIWGKKARVPVGWIANSGLKYLPERTNILGTEDWLYFSVDGIYFRGKYDFIFKDKDIFGIGDHKTKTNLDKALMPSELNKDPQATIYSAFIQTKYNVEINKLHWIYYLTVGEPSAKLVETEITKQDVDLNLDFILKISREIVEAKNSNKKVEEFRPPEGGCKAWKNKDQSCYYEELKMAGERKLADLLNVRAEQKKAVELVETGKVESGFTLLIDCLPRKGFDKVIEFSEILKAVFGMIADERNVAHPSFIPYESRGVFITTLDKYLSENPIPAGTVVVMSLTPDSRDALDVLIEHGARVVQAVSR